MNTRELHSYNETAAISIALALNFLLVYCVLTESEKFLRSYKNLILVSCFSEFVFILITIYVQPILFVQNALIIVVGGPLRNAAQWHVNVATCVFVWSFCFDNTKLLIEFVARYQIVCNATKLTVRRLLVMTAAVYIGTSFQIICFLTSFLSNPTARWSSTLSDPMWSEEDGSLVRFAVSDTTAWGCRAFVLGGSIFITLTYGVIIVCSRKITVVLEAQSSIFSPKTRKLHRGLTYMLVLQAAIPVFISIVPATLAMITLLLGSGSAGLSLVISMMLHWTPCIGPGFTLLCIPTYRARLLSIFCCDLVYKRSTSITAFDSRIRSSRMFLPELIR